MDVKDLNTALALLNEWDAAHPVKTYAQDFFEKFPCAPKQPSGRPSPCIRDVYGYHSADTCRKSEITGACIDCWNRPMKEAP